MAQTKAQLLNPLNGSINISGIVTSGGFKVGTAISMVDAGIKATTFYGDGSALTGITAGATLSAGSGDQKVVLTSKTAGQVMTTAGINAQLTYNSTSSTLSALNFNGNATSATNAQGLTGTPNITINNLVGAAATFTGVLTYEDVTNVDSIGVVTARAGIEFGLAGVGGTITADGHAEFVGVCTSSSFIKEGGTSSQFLKGDGSVDSTSYANTGKAIAMAIVFG